MFFIFGQRNFGKVDRVPGVFYVVTQFFHINFVPLIPLTTYLVLEGSESGNGFKGVKIPMSFKSIVVAWGRWALIIGALITAAFGLISLLAGVSARDVELMVQGVVLGLASVLCGVTFWATYHFSKAGHDRAMQLADEIGLSQAFVAKCLDPNRGRGEPDPEDMLEAEPASADERDKDPDRDYDRRQRERDRDYDRDYDRRERDRDYDRRD